MSITITKGVKKEKLSKILPRPYIGLYGNVSIPEPMIVVVFDDSVVMSSTLRKALHRVGDTTGTLVLVGTDFTEESRVIAHENSAFLLARTYHGWTDQRHEEIRTLIGAKVKKLDLR